MELIHCFDGCCRLVCNNFHLSFYEKECQHTINGVVHKMRFCRWLRSCALAQRSLNSRNVWIRTKIGVYRPLLFISVTIFAITHEIYCAADCKIHNSDFCFDCVFVFIETVDDTYERECKRQPDLMRFNYTSFSGDLQSKKMYLFAAARAPTRTHTRHTECSIAPATRWFRYKSATNTFECRCEDDGAMLLRLNYYLFLDIELSSIVAHKHNRLLLVPLVLSLLLLMMVVADWKAWDTRKHLIKSFRCSFLLCCLHATPVRNLFVDWMHR